MASIFGHALSSLAITSCFGVSKKQVTKVAIVAVLCAVIPDADIIMFRFGIPYSHPFGHRGFSHSLFFAVLFALGMRWLFFRGVARGSKTGWLLFILFFICTASHGILDAMTTGGRGIAFFGPFYNERFFLPWRVIQVSPLHASQFFSSWGLAVIKSEAIWIGLPSLAILFFNRLRAKQRN